MLELFLPLEQLVFEASLAAWSDAAVALVRGADRERRPLARKTTDGSAAASPSSDSALLAEGFLEETGRLLFFPELREAFQFLRDRAILSSDDFRSLVGAARRNAFTITGVESKRALEAANELLTQAVAEGWTGEKFREQLDAKFQQLGLTKLEPSQVSRVFRTNISSARSEAHDRTLDNPVIREVFQFDRYDAIIDDRSDPTHEVLDNWVFRHDDPVWDEGDEQPMRPPRRPNCRCSRTALSTRQFLDLYRAGTVRYGSESIALTDPDTGKSVRVRRDPGTDSVLRRANVR